eukprot:UN11676
MQILQSPDQRCLLVDHRFWNSHEAMVLNSDTTILGGTLFARSNRSITIMQDLNSTGSHVTLIANRDCSSGAYSITLASSKTLTCNNVHLIGGDVYLNGAINVGSGQLTFTEQCSNFETVSKSLFSFNFDYKNQFFEVND